MTEGGQRKARLGELDVTRIGFGAMQLAGPGVKGPPSDPDGARSLLRTSLGLGVDHIDTAQYYGPDVVNELIREALDPWPDDVLVATKVGVRLNEEGAPGEAISEADIRTAVDLNLSGLGRERLDLVNLRPVTIKAPDDDRLAEALGALAALRSEGKIRMIGISGVSTAVAARALDLTEVVAVQNSFSILDQTDRPTLEVCRERGIAYVPYFPLGSAFVGGPASLGDDEAIAAVAARRGVTPSQVALAWLLSLYEGVLPIPGTKSLLHLKENMAAGEIGLDADDLAELENVKQLGDPRARLKKTG